jgi:hypothetical protein
VSLEILQRHYRATPRPVIFFMAGSLPARALHHMRQFTLLGMIARLGPNHILFQLGSSILNNSASNSHSWFLQMKTLCSQYSLPDPLSILSSPQTKESFKRSVKLKVLDWWHTKLRAEAAPLDSLSLFRADFMSLSSPHPIWKSAGCSPHEVKKATVQARMLGGRYRTCWLRRHWSGDQSGSCRIPGCTGEPGTLLHLGTAQCQGLASAKVRALALWRNFLRDEPNLFPLICDFSLGDPEDFLAFLVDPTTQTKVISLAQSFGTQYDVIGKLCYMTRTWLFTMHKERLKLMGLWN